MLFDVGKYRFGYAFSDLEFDSLKKLCVTLSRFGMLEDVLRCAYSRLCREFYAIQTWSPRIALKFLRYNAMMRPSEDLIEALVDAVTSVDPLDSLSKVGQEEMQRRVERFQKLLDGLSDDNFSFLVGSRFRALLTMKQSEVNAISSILLHVKTFPRGFPETDQFRS
jgi:hypothetical protein